MAKCGLCQEEKELVEHEQTGVMVCEHCLAMMNFMEPDPDEAYGSNDG